MPRPAADRLLERRDLEDQRLARRRGGGDEDVLPPPRRRDTRRLVAPQPRAPAAGEGAGERLRQLEIAVLRIAAGEVRAVKELGPETRIVADLVDQGTE